MADYHSLLMRAVANLPNAGTSATRGAIYERARKALVEQLRSLRPPLPESDITREESALDAAIAAIEERYGPQDPAPPLASPTPIPACSRKASCGAEGRSAAPAPNILYGPAPQRACGARAGRSFGANAFANRCAKPTRGRSRARSGRDAATSAADAREDPAVREPAASANPGCREASRSGAAGGFAGSIPAGCCNGQPAFLRIEDRPGRSAGGSEGRQG